MKRMIGAFALMVLLGQGILANKDSLLCLELSGKLVKKGAEQFRAYRIELRSGEELIRTIYSVNDERFTLLLKRNTQYSMKVFDNGAEIKQVFINTHLPWKDINTEHRFDLNIEFPDSECESYREKTRATGGTVNFDPEKGTGITKPKY